MEAGGDVGRLENNIVKSLSDFCAEPADLDVASASEVVATCSDQTKLAVVDPATTDAAREIALPAELAPAIGGSLPKVAIFPTATYVDPDYEEPSSGEKIALAYVGFTQALNADTSQNYFLASGVHTVVLDSGGTKTSIVFDTVDASGPGGEGREFDNTGNVVGVFTPNRPTALFAVQVPVETAEGEEPKFQTRLVVATANPRGEIDGTPILGPGTFQLMTVSNGFAVPADDSAFGEDSFRLPKAQFDSEGHYVPPPVDGSVDPANLSATVYVGDYGLVGGAPYGSEGNFFLVAQEGESLSLWNAKAEPTGNISLGFRPSAQGNVPVIESFKGVAGKYAVLGTEDDSGRVILVNLNDSSQQPVGVFETGNIQSIALSADKKYAYVMNTDGEVRVLTLADGKVSTQTFEFAKSGGPCLTLAKGLACFTAEGLAFAPFGD